tara:strand:- start:169 stop:408 length:240 start_codon:yes stop_codon:yes gene_type:complete
MNKKAIVTKKKKKLRVGQAVFNKKAGIHEWQIREGGKVVHREPVDEMREKFANQPSDYKANIVTYDEEGNAIYPTPNID